MSDETTTRNIKIAAQLMLGGGFVLSAIAIFRETGKNGQVKGLGNGRQLNEGPSKLLQLPNVSLPTSMPQPRGKTMGRPKLKQYDVTDIDERAGLIGELIRKGSLNADLRERTVEILAMKCDSMGRVSPTATNYCVKEKDCLGEVKAIFDAIRNPKSKYSVRYTRDAMLADVFTAPERTLLKTHGGDCFVKGTKVLTDKHQLVAVETLRVGDRIWGHNDWSMVTKTWEKDILPTSLIRLNNGSSMRLTRNHKVWIYRCRRKHSGRYQHNCVCSMEHRDLARITVDELREGMVLTQPDKVAFGTEEFDPRRAYVEGLYIADGSSGHAADFDIAGQDGCPKEEQKREVEGICRALGISTRWARKQIVVKDKTWAQRVKTMGTKAWNKHALSIGLNEAAARELLRGLMADSGKNTNGDGSTFTTTSRELWLQMRVLLKMAGLTASERYIEKHGGLGKHPIWRLGIREQSERTMKYLRVKSVKHDNVELPCFDIETDDHFVWLPEADWSTSQCDDAVITIGSMLMGVGHPVRMRIVATRVPGVDDAKTPWSHIYLLTPTTFDNPNAKWISVDGSMDRPLGWEAPGAAEVARTGKPSGIISRVRDYTLVKPAEQG